MASKHIHTEETLLKFDHSIRDWAYENAYTLIFCSFMMLAILVVWCGITITVGGGFG